MDQTIFNETWRADKHYDATQNPFTSDFNFINPPYSLGTAFVIKSGIEYLKGANTVLLVPRQCINT
jgi:hypothetical protein